jgi:serine/threonine protein kinase
VLTDSNELLGKALGTCTLKRLLGRGGMGAVYLAQQSRPRRTVAVKVLMPGIVMEQRSRAEFLARFRREADAIAALDHVNIMPVYEYGEQEEIAYLVMPYVAGGTLREVLQKRGTLPLKDTLPIIDQIAAGLDSAHAQGIVHRDLKPGNILLHADGRVLIADFGLAKVLKETAEQDSSGRFALTSVGTIVGTPEYLSPEQGTGQGIDQRSDIYSLGIMLFQMLAGRVPFTGVSPVAVAIKHTLEEPPSLTQMNPSIPTNVEAVVMKALAKKPEERYSSAGELARALRAAASEHPQEPATDVQKPAPAPADPVEAQSGRSVEEQPDGPSTSEVSPDNKTVIDDLPTMDIHEAETAQALHMPTQPPPTPVMSDEEAHDADRLEAAPTLLADSAHQPQVQPSSARSVHSDATIADMPRVETGSSEKKKRPGQVTLAQVDQIERVDQRAQGNRAPARRSGCQSMGMMLLGSILTLVIIVGGFAAYLHFAPPTKPQTTKGTTATAKPQTTSTPVPKATASLPKPAIPAGALLYGTSLPGPGCDSQGGQWASAPSGVKVACSATATEIANNGSGQAGVFLSGLHNGQQIPSDYILQVQVSIKPGSHGRFGIFFRNQPGNQGKYAFLLDPSGSGTWSFYAYDNTTGQATQLASFPAQGSMNGTLTIDIVVQGSNFTPYINGTQQGAGESGAYTSGTLGLALESGADISFKNLAIYALS